MALGFQRSHALWKEQARFEAQICKYRTMISQIIYQQIRFETY